MKKLPDINVLLKLTKTMTLLAIADRYSCHKSLVQQRLKNHPDYVSARWHKNLDRDENIITLVRQGHTEKETAEILGVTRKTVSGVKFRNRIQSKRKLKSIGCDKCKTNHYARGLCKNCYARWLHRGKEY